MEIVIELLFVILGEIVAPVFGELLIELGFESLASPFRDKRSSSPILAAIGLVALGALLGWTSTISYPGRLIAKPLLPGASLVIAPLVSGGVMQWFGVVQMSRGKSPTRLASFWGGALLAFTFAFTRFVLL